MEAQKVALNEKNFFSNFKKYLALLNDLDLSRKEKEDLICSIVALGDKLTDDYINSI